MPKTTLAPIFGGKKKESGFYQNCVEGRKDL